MKGWKETANLLAKHHFKNSSALYPSCSVVANEVWNLRMKKEIVVSGKEKIPQFCDEIKFMPGCELNFEGNVNSFEEDVKQLRELEDLVKKGEVQNVAKREEFRETVQRKGSLFLVDLQKFIVLKTDVLLKAQKCLNEFGEIVEPKGTLDYSLKELLDAKNESKKAVEEYKSMTEEKLRRICLFGEKEVSCVEDLEKLFSKSKNAELKLLECFEKERDMLKLFVGAKCEHYMKERLALKEIEQTLQKKVIEAVDWSEMVGKEVNRLSRALDCGRDKERLLKEYEIKEKELRDEELKLEEYKLRERMLESKGIKRLKQDNKICSDCEEVEAKIFCIDCNEKFCQECFSVVHQRKKFSSHSSSEIKQDSTAILDPNERVRLARVAFMKVAKELAVIKLNGYPELNCPAISKAADLTGIPILTREDLQKLEPLSDFQIIGEGAFSRVYRLEIAGAEGPIAFKRFNQNLVNVEQMKKEAELIFKLRHPNVVRLLGLCLDKGFEGLVLEYVEGGSLASRVHNNALNKKVAYSLLHRACLGLEFIHKQNHMHLDIKAANILVSTDLQTVKLSDFGTAKELRETMIMMTLIPGMTVRWSAPERFESSSKVTSAADVYSMGMVLYEMLTGKVPFQDESNDMQLIGMIQGGKRHPDTNGLDSDCVELMKKCWNIDPLKRPKAGELIGLVSQFITQKCCVCDSEMILSRGAECSVLPQGHFGCFDCISNGMKTALSSNDPKLIPEEGHVKCLDSKCHGIIETNLLKVDSGLLVKWSSASSNIMLEQADLRNQTMVRELEDLKKFGPVERHARSITRDILTDSCPRCKTAFFDFSGCFALHCSNPKCSCAFCGWCLKDCGSNAHDHVSRCDYKLSDDDFFGTMQQFNECKRRRQTRLVIDYLKKIDDLETRNQVLNEIRKHIEGIYNEVSRSIKLK